MSLPGPEALCMSSLIMSLVGKILLTTKLEHSRLTGARSNMSFGKEARIEDKSPMLQVQWKAPARVI